MVELISGHKTPECDGKWIDVGTLMNPRDQMCVVCRGHRQKPLVEEERSETVEEGYIDDVRVTRSDGLQRWTKDDLRIERDEDAEPMPRYSRGMQMLGGFIIAAAIVAAFILMHLSTRQ